MDIDAETQRVEGFVSAGNYHAAYNIALSALNACRRNNDQQGVDRMLGCIQKVVDALSQEFAGAAES
jgi:hypothetical protein